MNAGISPENEQFLQEAVARGTFDSREQALDAAVDMLREREEVIREVNKGIEEIERGEYGRLDFNELKSRIGQQLADKQASG